MNKISTIVFDVGNVLLDWNPQSLLEKIVGTSDWDNHPLKKIVGDSNWLEMDRGILTLEGLADKYLHIYPDHHEDIYSFLKNVGTVISPISGSFDIVKRCKSAGYRLLILSNFGSEAWGQVTERFDVFSHFEGGIISWEENLIKPEPEIYQLLIDKYELVPEETLFIDDTLENIEGAASFGIKTLYLPVGSNLKEQLEEIVPLA